MDYDKFYNDNLEVIEEYINEELSFAEAVDKLDISPIEFKKVLNFISKLDYKCTNCLKDLSHSDYIYGDSDGLNSIASGYLCNKCGNEESF